MAVARRNLPLTVCALQDLAVRIHSLLLALP